jgi:CMP-N-acetylneuraminic acid synthetase
MEKAAHAQQVADKYALFDNYLALIPARGGSKRLPNKNLLLLGGKPLINWTIDFAKLVFPVENVLVSTDSQLIASVATENGASAPWLRPADISTDKAKSVDVALHALDWFEAKHGRAFGLVLLQPTSPFRSPDSITRLIKQHEAHNRCPVVSVSPSSSHPFWTFKVRDEKLDPYVNSDARDKRSQDLPPAYTLNGNLYVISSDDLRANRSFITRDTEALVLDNPLSEIDIDTELDFQFAEFVISRGLVKAT